LVGELASLASERALLAGIKRSDRDEEQRRRFDSIPSLIRTRKAYFTAAGKLQLSYFTSYQLCFVLAEALSQAWTPEEYASLASLRKQGEGPGEKALCMRFGLPLAGPNDKIDLMGRGDVKWLDNGTGGVQLMQVGTCGSEAYCSLLLEGGEAGLFRSLADEQRRLFMRGEVFRSALDSMPQAVSDAVKAACRPSKALAGYLDIHCAFQFGFIVVPAAHADDAWELVSITKGRPRYALRRDYVVGQLLATQQQPEVTA
jgi:hypothetical protein